MLQRMMYRHKSVQMESGKAKKTFRKWIWEKKKKKKVDLAPTYNHESDLFE